MTTKAARPVRTGGLRDEAGQAQLTELSAGVSAMVVERRLDTTTAATIIAAAISAMVSRSGVEADSPTEKVTMAGAISTETRFITLISGLIDGPAVSLNGSPPAP